MLFFRGTPVSQEVEEDIVDIFLEDSDLHAKSKAYLHSSNRLQGQARKTVLVLQGITSSEGLAVYFNVMTAKLWHRDAFMGNTHGSVRRGKLCKESEFLRYGGGQSGVTNCVNEVAHCAGEDVVVASYGATTCCIVAIGNPLEKRLTLAHVDEGTLRRHEDMEKLLAQVGKWEMGPNNRWVWVQQMCRAELYIVGAYCSVTGYKVAHGLLSFFQQHPAQLHLELACIGSANTLPCGAPTCQDLAFDTLSWTCFPGTYRGHGPMLAARSARIWSGEFMEIGSGLMAIYNPAGQALVIPPLAYPKPLPNRFLLMVSQYLRLSDEELLQETSTSPDHEAPVFARETRAALQWILEQSECPTMQSKPAVYRWHDGVGWRHEVPFNTPERLPVNASAVASLSF